MHFQELKRRSESIALCFQDGNRFKISLKTVELLPLYHLLIRVFGLDCSQTGAWEPLVHIQILRMGIGNPALDRHFKVVHSRIGPLLIVRSESGQSTFHQNPYVLLNPEDEVYCLFASVEDNYTRVLQLIKFSRTLAVQAEFRGGLLLHGALIAHKGLGYIISGRSGSGKTTACNRLPTGWEALSDDMVLVVRSAEGSYYAHPWPTWSLYHGGVGGVEARTCLSVPLCSVSFIRQHRECFPGPCDHRHAAALLIGASEQIWAKDEHAGKNQRETLRKQRFFNITGMLEKVEFQYLNMNLKDPFWHHLSKH